MRLKRLVAAGTAAGLLGALASTGMASAAAAPGVGTSQVHTTVLSADLGDILNLRLLGDDGRATIDKLVSNPEAFSSLVGAQITSKVLPALNLSVPASPIEARSPGGQANNEIKSASLAPSVPGVAVPVSVLGGTLDAALRTTLSEVAATAGLDATLKNVGLVGGLISVDSLGSVLGAGTTQGVADSNRSVNISGIDVLNLGELLDGLGIPLGDLPVSAVTSIVSQLGLPIAGVPAGVGTGDFVSQLNAAIDQAQGLIQGGDVVGTVTAPVAGLLGTLALPIPDTSSTVAQVNALVDSLQLTLAGVLNQALSAIDGVSLLHLDGLQVGVVTKATQDIASSVAEVTATLGAIKIGNIALPGVDLLSSTAAINGLVGQVNGTIGGVLGTISPDLANLVNVSVLDKVQSVTQTGGYTRSRAGITGLVATIAPPADLLALVNSLTSAVGVGEVIGQLGGAVPGLSTAMSTLESTLGIATAALASGATIKVAEVASASDFAAAGIPIPVTELPRTGGATPLALIGFLSLATALGIRRKMTATAVKA